MAKTTKLVRGIHSWIKFQKHQGVESLSIEGKQALADLSQDNNGDTNLILNADKDKVNTVASNVPYLAISHTTTGTDPNQEKTATISQDLTQFNLGSDGLIDVSKTETAITLYTTKITEKINEVVNNTVTAKDTEIREFIGTVKEELTNKINEHAGNESNQSPKTASFLGMVSVDTSKFIKDFSLKPEGDVEIHGICVLYVNYLSAGTPQSFILPFYADDIGLKNINGVSLQVKNSGPISIDVTLPTVPTQNFSFMMVAYNSTKAIESNITVTAIE